MTKERPAGDCTQAHSGRLRLGFLLYLICAIGIRNGAIGMIHLYDPKVQERVVQLGLTTAEEIRKRSVRFRSLCLPGYLVYVLICVYLINGARGFLSNLILSAISLFIYWRLLCLTRY